MTIATDLQLPIGESGMPGNLALFSELLEIDASNYAAVMLALERLIGTPVLALMSPYINSLQAVATYGSDELPEYGATDAGRMIFDTDLGQPVWWTGTAWVAADGTDPYPA
jgi:hypothetical protein